MIKNNKEYIEQKFSDLDLKKTHIEESTFENCSFVACVFDDSSFVKCKLIDCSFKNCSLNLVKLSSTSLIDTEFDDCKMKGINWTEISFPYITVSSPIFFTHCDISFSSFYELKLPGISIADCKAHEVDFRSADLSSSDLSSTDFNQSQFHHTNLKEADLRQSINYIINPVDNNIKKAHFSFPEVINLLSEFNVNIDHL